MRRLATITLSLFLLLGLSGAHHAIAQDETKKDETPKSEDAKPEASRPDAPEAKPKDPEKAKEATPKPEAAAEATPPPIPPEVEAKLEAARRAVAEAIVAAQDAGLVKTTINPPPILDVLITGRANDESTLKARTGVSPEVFGAWFTGYGTTPDINPQKDVRITRPDAGLKELYSQRSSILNRHIDAVRKAQGTSKPEETPAAKEGSKEDKAKESRKETEPSKPQEDNVKKDQDKEDSGGESAKEGNKSGDSPKDDGAQDDKKGDASGADAPQGS